jgi:hypothetical protein
MVKEGVPYVVTHVASTCPEGYDICLKILMNVTCVNDKFARIEDITEVGCDIIIDTIIHHNYTPYTPYTH